VYSAAVAVSMTMGMSKGSSPGAEPYLRYRRDTGMYCNLGKTDGQIAFYLVALVFLATSGRDISACSTRWSSLYHVQECNRTDASHTWLKYLFAFTSAHHSYGPVPQRCLCFCGCRKSCLAQYAFRFEQFQIIPSDSSAHSATLVPFSSRAGPQPRSNPHLPQHIY
jgi:hypothetical protein